jgi:DNA-binding IclR family transcriptional regulator
VRLVSPVGRRLPAHATAEGKALLAGLPDATVAGRYAAAGPGPELPRLTARALDSLPLLLAELRAVRALGHAHDVDEHAEGLHCVAAPVVDATGAHQAALGVAVPTPQVAWSMAQGGAPLFGEIGRAAEQLASPPSASAARRAATPTTCRRCGWSSATRPHTTRATCPRRPSPGR